MFRKSVKRPVSFAEFDILDDETDDSCEKTQPATPSKRFARNASLGVEELHLEDEEHDSYSEVFAQLDKKRKQRCPRYRFPVLVVLLMFFLLHEWASVAITLSITSVNSMNTLNTQQRNSEDAINTVFRNAQAVTAFASLTVTDSCM